MSASRSFLQHASLVTLATLGLGLSSAASATAPKASTQSVNPALGTTLVGSWRCAGTGGLDGVRFLTTFNAGGTFTVSFSDKVFSETHGVWKRTGLRSFASTDQAFLYAANGVADRIQTVDATYAIQTPVDLAITISGVVSQLADDAVVLQFDAVVNCKRMLID
jgi:hypothetical protein